MNLFKLAALFSTLLLFANPGGSLGLNQSEAKRTPVLVELFTSEGCSSCPPADAFLVRLEEEQPVADGQIIALEEHVDYWDHQGWNDPYSSADWTARQEGYVDHLKEKSSFTPQIIVDGQHSVSGGREREILRAIMQASHEPRADLSLKEESASTGQVNLRLRVGKFTATPGDLPEVWLAVAERNLSSSVTGGENAGKELRHSAVLRSLKRVGAATAAGESSYEGAAVIKLKHEWKRENLEWIAFVQEKKSRKVLGAAALKPAGLPHSDRWG
jgi:hypothetical protein